MATITWKDQATIDAEKLEEAKAEKLQELYDAYQAEKWSEVVTSLVGPDGNPIVFGYSPDNRTDYMAIANKFALDDTKTESLIGSKSHGKFMITREDFQTFTNDAESHEVNLYNKIKQKQEEVETAYQTGDISAIEAITW